MKPTLNRVAFAFLSAALFFGCGGGDGGGNDGGVPDAESGSLIRQSEWVVDTDDNNVFGAAPVGIECIEEIDYRVESLGALVFAISTANLCDFLTVFQSTRLNIRAGDLVQLRAFHFTLSRGRSTRWLRWRLHSATRWYGKSRSTYRPKAISGSKSCGRLTRLILPARPFIFMSITTATTSTGSRASL